MKRAPYFNGWMIWACCILALCMFAPLSDGDPVTWIGWGIACAIAFGARSYQYFIQRR